ncbi:MAG: hypothetical protein Q7U38_14290 [Methylobacter sp.]|nr:hypothetical protein [Methylobacter sp.]MDP2169667.1 hypothetical protein [Rhodocyclaceae bacterium]MDP2429020.1 hypothetical protein [Methylobacter sp.]MDP3056521.1 hypothetical protein [Methylobacter sp.]MDP3362010.1 hypothetical protein [Methylobacter sp.]
MSTEADVYELDFKVRSVSEAGDVTYMCPDFSVLIDTETGFISAVFGTGGKS